MSKHRGVVPPLRVRVDGLRLKYRPGSVDAPGIFTRLADHQARRGLREEADGPVRGVLVTAERESIPGVLAGLHSIAQRQVFVEEIPPVVEEWFTHRRAQAHAHADTSVDKTPAKGRTRQAQRLKRKTMTEMAAPAESVEA